MVERYWSFGRVLKELNLTREGLTQLIYQGYLRTYQDRKRIVFRKEDVEQLRASWHDGPVYVQSGVTTGNERVGGVTSVEVGEDRVPPTPTPTPTLEELGLETDSDPKSAELESLPESAIRPRLGQILKAAGVCREPQIHEALEIQAARRERGDDTPKIGRLLAALGHATDAQVMEALAQQLRLDFVRLDTVDVPVELAWVMPREIADEYHVVPVRIEPTGALVVATADPQLPSLADCLALTLGRSVILVVATQSAIDQHHQRIYSHVPRRVLEPVRTPSGRLRLPTSKISTVIARQASEQLRRWFAEPGESEFTPAALGPRVFLAMPFKKSFDPVAETILHVVQHLGGRPLRIDQVPNLRNVWLAIEREIARADVVVADFSGDRVLEVPNPNVVTEAAIAFHKYEKPVVVLTQSTAGLFFDWRHQLAIVYEPHETGLSVFSERLANRLAAEFTELGNGRRWKATHTPEEPV